MTRNTKIGIVAPSSRVPQKELKQGLARLKAAGYSLQVHPQVKKNHLFFAGNDTQRAAAFWEYALNPKLPVLWSARGGWGAARILPQLEKYTRQNGIPPRKLLVGYSDTTSLHEFVRSEWGWVTLHAPMPGLGEFTRMKEKDFRNICQFVDGTWGAKQSQYKVKFLGAAPKSAIEGELVGGNLSVWTALLGTPYASKASGKILFFEDVSEAFYRIDRLLYQCLSSRSLEGVKAIVLGTFEDCGDRIMAPQKALREVFGALGAALGVPVGYGLKVGHVSGQTPLPLGGRYRLEKTGQLVLQSWDW
ncbi:LD-carboxypeptidase [bacterium]|jgi:muramoyltetrapeptide carboxypeptidase|nr:LD-carboxypeptidase [bacterium]